MRTWFSLYGQMVLNLITARLAEYQGEPTPAGGRRKFPVWAIILIAAVVVLCLIPVCIFLILILLGPSIGNVFSGIVEELETTVTP